MSKLDEMLDEAICEGVRADKLMVGVDARRRSQMNKLDEIRENLAVLLNAVPKRVVRMQIAGVFQETFALLQEGQEIVERHHRKERHNPHGLAPLSCCIECGRHLECADDCAYNNWLKAVAQPKKQEEK